MPSTYNDRLNGLATSVAVKAPCRVETTTNITLSGIQTVNGVLVSAGTPGVTPPDRVLVKDQTDPKQNGIYDVSAGNWTRALDFDGERDAVNGTIVFSQRGAGFFYKVTTANPVQIGTSNISFAPMNFADPADVAIVVGIATQIAQVAAVDDEVVTVSGISTQVATVAGISAAITTNANNIAAIQSASNNANIAKAAAGFAYTYSSTTTAADPGAGFLRFNNASLASATALYISETSGMAQAIAAEIATWDDSTSTIRGKLRLFKQEDPSVFALFNVTGTLTDNGTWDTLTVAYVGGSGTIINNDVLTVQYLRTGDKGDQGIQGNPGNIAVAIGTGTVDAITADFTPDQTLTDKNVVIVLSSGPNTVTGPTLNIDSLGARTIVKKGGQALVAGDTGSAGYPLLLEYNLANTRWELMNPSKVVGADLGASSITSAQLAAAMSDEVGAGRAVFESAITPAPGGRLTLASATPVATTNQIGATTIYYAPYIHNQVSLYSGTVWQLLTFSQISAAVPATSNTPYDVFLYNNAGSVAIELVAWTNANTRAVALGRQDGRYIKSTDATRLFIGTVATAASSGTVDDSTLSRTVCNFYNKVPRLYSAQVSGSGTPPPWSYSTAAWRATNNDSTYAIRLINCANEEPFWVTRIFAEVFNSTTAVRGIICGVGLNSTTAASLSAAAYCTSTQRATPNGGGGSIVGLSGLNTIYSIEFGAGTDTQSWQPGTLNGIGFYGYINA